jgi:hypothetical protein
VKENLQETIVLSWENRCFLLWFFMFCFLGLKQQQLAEKWDWWIQWIDFHVVGLHGFYAKVGGFC